jgi:hypothetical protein
MAVFELVTVDGRTILFQHEAASIAAFLRALVANRFVVGDQVGSARSHGAGQAVPIGITFHSIAQVRLEPEPGENRDRELIEHHALSDYRERG